ncbi:MAG: deoxynucleoside kinase [Bdellovibrionales bacterium]
MANDNLLIGIGGGIAARKTTIGLSLQEAGRDCVRFYPEPASNENEMLWAFYSDPDLFAEPMQFNALRLRFGITKRVMQDMKMHKEQGRFALFAVERMWPWDWSFMRANFFMGRFREPGMDDLDGSKSESLRDYNMLMDEAWSSLFVANLMVFIDITPQESFERIKARARGCEVRLDPKCYACSGTTDPMHTENSPGMVTLTCSMCQARFVTEEGPIPLKYLDLLDKAHRELESDMINRGYPFSCISGTDNLSYEDILDAVDRFADSRNVDDYDKQIQALEALEERSLQLYEKYLQRAGKTRDEILEGHRKYIENETKRVGGKIDES